MSWPSWMPPSRKPESDTWCEKHQCQKTWMITSGFCPACEKELHGDKGSVSSPPDDNDEGIDLEVTIPDFKIIKHCIDCHLQKPHGFNLTKCRSLVYTNPYSFKECICKLSCHKWNDFTEFYQCTKCLGYNREFNKK